jgi:hypothetical protein
VKKIIPLRSDLLALVLTTLGVIFVLVAQAPGKTNAAVDKCQVCHNDKNPHTIDIPCDQVDKYLANHPGDFAGSCPVITNEKPPKKK